MRRGDGRKAGKKGVATTRRSSGVRPPRLTRRILGNLTHNLIRLDKKWALGAACIGGGQGIAVVLERC
jgi:hypothetical protein